MKNIVIIIAIAIGAFSQSILAQNYIDTTSPLFKKKETKKYILKNSKIEDRASYFPSPELKRFKVKSDIFKTETTVTLFLEEYHENKKIETDDDLLESGIYANNTRFSVEIVPDTSNAETLKIHTLLPGSISYKYKNINKDRVFKSIPFSKKNQIGKKDIPIVFLYEDDLSNKMENIISKYIINDSLSVQLDHTSKPYSEINRYIAIFYNTSPNK